MTGLNGSPGECIIKSECKKTAIWAGVIDDLWELGKPPGALGVWKDSRVRAGAAPLPCLMTGHDRKSVTASTQDDAGVTLEVDVDGKGLWVPWKTFELKAEAMVRYVFPDGFSAYWVRAVCSVDTRATVTFHYE